MQNKGFVSVIAVLLALFCLFHISFTWVVRGLESDADAVAKQDAAVVAAESEISSLQAQPQDQVARQLVVKQSQRDSIFNAARKVYLDSVTEDYSYCFMTYKDLQKKQIGLGLDLEGGMNVVLEIDVAEVLKFLAGENGDDETFKKALAETDKSVSGEEFVDQFAKNFTKEGGVKLARVFNSTPLRGKINLDSEDAQVISVIKEEMNISLKNSFEVLRNRIDRFGVVAPNIQELSQAGRILVELPGVKEPERVKKLLQGSAKLEFWETYALDNELASAFRAASEKEMALLAAAAAPAVEVAEEVVAEETAAEATEVDEEDLAPVEEVAEEVATEAIAEGSVLNKLTLAPVNGGVGYAYYGDTAAITRVLNANADLFPRNLKWAWGVKGGDAEEWRGNVKGSKKETHYVLYALKYSDKEKALPALSDAVIDGNMITKADHDFRNGEYLVTMTMTTDAANEWSKITGKNINHCVAIVLDGLVYSAPNVNQQINGGDSQISGSFTLDEASDLANVLQAGKMVAPVKIVSSTVVGPSLGQQAIDQSKVSFIVALVLLFIYMILFYGTKAGLVADVCLIINAFFTVGILSSFGAVLTLSGIAGIVLSMGIAVDANVLIYERAKEELAAGKSLPAAVTAAYQNAFSAIFDANLTSLLTGLILYNFGTGPIRGFAFTFIVGIITSFCSAVFLSRIFIEGGLKGMFKNLTFTGACSSLLKPTNIDFVKKGKVGRWIYGVVCALAIVLMLVPGFDLGIDFKGGRNYSVTFVDANSINVQDLTNKLTSDATLNGATVKVITLGSESDKQVRVTTDFDLNATDDAAADKVVKTAIYNAGKELGYTKVADFVQFDNTENIPSTEKVGPSIANDIIIGAIWAIVFSLIAIGLYILLRFRNVAFSVGAILGLIANVLVIMGLYCVLPAIMPFSMEVDQAFIAAILTVIGYSINDIVVVFDRIREVMGLYPNKNKAEVINDALNATMPRTLNTSISTLIVLLVIFFVGGASMQSFIFAMLVGVIVDPLTTIFLAVPTAHFFMRKKEAKASKK